MFEPSENVIKASRLLNSSVFFFLDQFDVTCRPSKDFPVQLVTMNVCSLESNGE